MTVLTNARVYHGQRRMDTDMTAVSSSFEAEEVDDTVFNDNTRSNEGGLKVISVGYEGLVTFGAGEVDDRLFSDVGTGDLPITVAANAAADGDECYFSRYLFSQFEFGGTVGDSHTFSGGAVARGDPLVRGFTLLESTETSNGTGTAVQVGSVASDETVYGVLHVTASSGDSSQTLDVTIESDDASGFGSPTTQLTFSQVTTSATFGWQSKAGAITDDWWRAEWTVGGTGSPSFDVYVAAGIV